jgi:hypothetical protein
MSSEELVANVRRTAEPASVSAPVPRRTIEAAPAQRFSDGTTRMQRANRRTKRLRVSMTALRRPDR